MKTFREKKQTKAKPRKDSQRKNTSIAIDKQDKKGQAKRQSPENRQNGHKLGDNKRKTKGIGKETESEKQTKWS